MPDQPDPLTPIRERVAGRRAIADNLHSFLTRTMNKKDLVQIAEDEEKLLAVIDELHILHGNPHAPKPQGVTKFLSPF